MAYPDSSNRCYERDVNKILKRSQEVFSINLKTKRPEKTAEEERQEFAARLKIAFKGAQGREIYNDLLKFSPEAKISEADISDYLKGKRYPTIEKLLVISRFCKRNVHWLLTGKGEADDDIFGFLAETEQEIIRGLASNEGKEFEKKVRDLVRDALALKGSELFSNLDSLNSKERQLLQKLYRLVDEDGPDGIDGLDQHKGRRAS